MKELSRQQWRGLVWGLVGLLMGIFALNGAMGWAYRMIGQEPVTLSLGLGGCVISLIGIVKAFPHQSGWWLAWLVVATWVAGLGALADGLLLWFGQTVSGFY